MEKQLTFKRNWIGITISLLIMISIIFYFGIYEPNKLKEDVTESIKQTTASTINEHPNDIKVELIEFRKTERRGAVTYYKTVVDVTWNGHTKGALDDVEWETKLVPNGFGLIVSCDGCNSKAEAVIDTAEEYGRWVQIDKYTTKMLENIRFSYSNKIDGPKKPEPLIIDENYYKQFIDLYEENEEVDVTPDSDSEKPVFEEPITEDFGPTPEEREKINDDAYSPDEPFSDQREEIYGDMECPPPTYCDE